METTKIYLHKVKSRESVLPELSNQVSLMQEVVADWKQAIDASISTQKLGGLSPQQNMVFRLLRQGYAFNKQFALAFGIGNPMEVIRQLRLRIVDGNKHIVTDYDSKGDVCWRLVY